MNSPALSVGDPVRIIGVYFTKHRRMIGRTGTVEKIHRTKGQAGIRLADGTIWWATLSNLEPTQERK